MSPDKIDPMTAIRVLLARASGAVHLAGICGIGMAGLAVHLAHRGLRVTGCDRSADSSIAAWLRERGIPVTGGHDPAHIDDATEILIFSPALPLSHPELEAARKRGVPILRRGEVLPLLLEGRRSIAVAGTHGKTSTSTFIAQVLRFAGETPGFCIGGESAPLGGVADAGGGGSLIVEADESDGTLAGYAPEIAVITNIDRDHLEHFSGVEDLFACFETFAGRAKRVVYCNDDEPARRLGQACAQGTAYGLSADAAVRAEDIEEGAWSSTYRLVLNGRPAGRIDLPVPGRHNVLNSLAAIAALLGWGLDLEAIRAGLARVELPRRRFERIIAHSDLMVISDYAHHPAEIAALVRTARGAGYRRIRAVFQPHRYTRTLALGADFPEAWRGTDELALVPVYAASEPPLEGGSIGDLYAHFRAAETGIGSVLLAQSVESVWAYWQVTRAAGDLFLIVGAGDVDRMVTWVRQAWGGTPPAFSSNSPDWVTEVERLPFESSRCRRNEPLGLRTTLGVGGVADLWVDVGTERDLARLIRWSRERGVPLKILGGGSNVLVSDLGVRGIVARLAGGDFRRLRREGRQLIAGAAVPLSVLLGRSSEEGLAGLEFLEGIPGLVGGALWMNAGAWGDAVADRVVWVRALMADGREQVLTPAEVRFEYRRAPGLAGAVAVEAAFELTSEERESIERRRNEIAGRRAWMTGLRCVGSVFKNPPGDFAGRLIEAAGLKGTRIGGVTMGPRHANVFTAGLGARTGDVGAAIARVRMTVAARWGIELETEAAIWE
jgi:UDP-N-acetylmuramate--alanine ligase